MYIILIGKWQCLYPQDCILIWIYRTQINYITLHYKHNDTVTVAVTWQTEVTVSCSITYWKQQISCGGCCHHHNLVYSPLHSEVCSLQHVSHNPAFLKTTISILLKHFQKIWDQKTQHANNYDTKTFWKMYFTKCATDTSQNNNWTNAFDWCWNPVWNFCYYTVWSNTSYTDFILPQHLLSNQCCWPFQSSLLWTLKSKPSNQANIHNISWRVLFRIGKCVCDSDWFWWHKTYFLLMPSWALGKKLHGTKSRELCGVGGKGEQFYFFWQKFTK